MKKTKGATLGLSTEVRRAKIGVDDAMFLLRLETNDFPPKSNQYMTY